jgi:hypothetical protein
MKLPHASRGLVAISTIVGALVVFGAFGTAFVVQRLYFHGPPYAESALQVSVPSPWTSGQFTGMDHFTADELTRIHQGAQWGPISYVSSDVPSVRPDMVSVNAIDPYTWGAAAFSWRTHRCYLILLALDATNPMYGATFYGELSGNGQCIGATATRATVTGAQEPLE